MDQNLKNKTLEKLTQAESILITAPSNSNLDQTASALALYLSCKKFGKNVGVKAKLPTVLEAKKLYSVDKIGKLASETDGKVIISIDNAIDTVEKVTHFLDRDKLKIIVHPISGSKGPTKDDISFDKSASKPDILFVLGFTQLEQLKKEFAHDQFIDSKTWIISINHEKLNQKIAHVNISNPEAGSISEVTAQFIQSLSLPINEDIAFNLYTGISDATENFNPSKTTQLSLQISSWLIKFGAGRASLAQKPNPNIGRTMSEESVIPFNNETPDISQISQSLKKLAESQKLKKNTASLNNSLNTRPLEEVEQEKKSEKEWLKPPKVYKGSKSFDTES